jgi:hypothetical protein
VPAAGSTGGAHHDEVAVRVEVDPEDELGLHPVGTLGQIHRERPLIDDAQGRPDYITVSTPPDQEQQKYPLEVTLALSLARGCLECDCGDWAVDEWMWDMFFQDWLDGTLSRLFMMPAKPWSNKELTVYHAKRFRNAMAFRKQEANRGYNYARPARPMFPKGGWV